MFQFSEALSLVVHCQSQDEVDHYWNPLSAGGDENARQCGWLKDRCGLSWQVVPQQLTDLLTDPDMDKARRMAAMMQMKKIDVAALQRAAA
jgi:predicted 3-demethylubiquinone-9 3-methyltransferase (glyoxalase superfamily)